MAALEYLKRELLRIVYLKIDLRTCYLNLRYNDTISQVLFRFRSRNYISRYF